MPQVMPWWMQNDQFSEPGPLPSPRAIGPRPGGIPLTTGSNLGQFTPLPFNLFNQIYGEGFKAEPNARQYPSPIGPSGDTPRMDIPIGLPPDIPNSDPNVQVFTQNNTFNPEQYPSAIGPATEALYDPSYQREGPSMNAFTDTGGVFSNVPESPGFSPSDYYLPNDYGQASIMSPTGVGPAGPDFVSQNQPFDFTGLPGGGETYNPPGISPSEITYNPQPPEYLQDPSYQPSVQRSGLDIMPTGDTSGVGAAAFTDPNSIPTPNDFAGGLLEDPSFQTSSNENLGAPVVPQGEQVPDFSEPGAGATLGLKDDTGFQDAASNQVPVASQAFPPSEQDTSAVAPQFSSKPGEIYAGSDNPGFINNFVSGVTDLASRIGDSIGNIFTSDPFPNIAPGGSPVGSYTPDAVASGIPLPGALSNLGAGGGGIPNSWQFALGKGPWMMKHPLDPRTWAAWQSFNNYQGNALQGAKWSPAVGPITSPVTPNYQAYLNQWNTLQPIMARVAAARVAAARSSADANRIPGGGSVSSGTPAPKAA